jgi:predicted porin
LAPYISVSRGDWKYTEAGSAAFNVKMNTMQIGTTYAMSKRTTLYAASGSSKFKATVDGVAGSAEDKLRGFRLGVTHAF